MTIPTIEQLEGDPARAARAPILDAIDAFNDATTGLTEPSETLALVIRDPDTKEIKGGLYAVSYYGWLFVELLFIAEEHRRIGIGTQLIRHAETVARKRGCMGVWLDTFSFQARGFYEKLEYKVFGEIASYPPGQSRFWLKKHLEKRSDETRAAGGDSTAASVGLPTL